jgi:hypothetical protein
MFLVAVTNAVLRSSTLDAIRNSFFFLQTYRNYFKLIRLFSSNADTGGRAFYGIGLRPLTDWECGFEFRRGHECLSHVSVVYCQVEISATVWPLIQRSSNVCCVSEYDREALIMRGTWPTRGCCTVTKKILFQCHVLSFMLYAKHRWKLHKVLQTKTWRQDHFGDIG